jgi:hypothetical protein
MAPKAGFLAELGRRWKGFRVRGTHRLFDRSPCDGARHAVFGPTRLARRGEHLAQGDRLVAERTVLRGTGLVWRGDGRLDSFYRTRHPHVVSRRRSVRVTGARDAGREAGRKVVLQRPISSTGSRGRLLGGQRGGRVHAYHDATPRIAS